MSGCLKYICEEFPENLKWFYDNTQYEDVRYNIEQFLILFLETIMGDPMGKAIYGVNAHQIKELFPFIKYEDSIDLDENILEKTLMGYLNAINDCLNQEFLRVRTSHEYNRGTGRGIYFRISSIDFNWFPLIWDFVYKNKNWITDVTVGHDQQSGRGRDVLKIDGLPIYKMLTNDFLILKGNPILESNDSIETQILANRGSLLDAYPSNNYFLHRWVLKRKFFNLKKFFIKV